MNNDPLDYMIGGDHYRQGDVQPIQLIQALGMTFEEGSVVKYISRYRTKHAGDVLKQIDDLRKAIHYIEFIIAGLQRTVPPVQEFLAVPAEDVGTNFMHPVLHEHETTTLVREPGVHEKVSTTWTFGEKEWTEAGCICGEDPCPEADVPEVGLRPEEPPEDHGPVVTFHENGVNSRSETICLCNEDPCPAKAVEVP